MNDVIENGGAYADRDRCGKLSYEISLHGIIARWRGIERRHHNEIAAANAGTSEPQVRRLTADGFSITTTSRPCGHPAQCGSRNV